VSVPDSRPLPHAGVSGALLIANEFAEVTVQKVHTHNGVRLEVRSPRLGRSILLDALQLESLTWQEPALFSALLDEPFGPAPTPLVSDEPLEHDGLFMPPPAPEGERPAGR
jgi:hypothetical protein